MRLAGLTVALALCGCPKSEPPHTPADARPPDTLAPLSVGSSTQGLLYSFFDRHAEMKTVDELKQVADTARAFVMITHPSRRLPGDLIHVADLRKLTGAGTYKSWIEPKSAWLDRVMPKVSIDKTIVAVARKTPRLRRRRRRKPRPRVVQAPKPKHPRVLIFTAPGCPACRSAKAFFGQKGVPFEELNVAQSEQAQQQYRSLLKQVPQLKPGAVPVIVVGSQVFQGFSVPQLEAALAKAGT